MIRIIGYCDKCNSSIKECNDKIICGCNAKKNKLYKLNENKLLTKCLNCGEMFDFGNRKKKKNVLIFCKRCRKLRQKEQSRKWYESHKP